MSLKDLIDVSHPDPDEIVREGAAADAAQAEAEYAGLPRVLRYALMPNPFEVGERVVADVAALAPHLSSRMAAWASSLQRPGWASNALALDEASVRLDEPLLRALADVVRTSSMTGDEARAQPAESLRVVATLTAAAREASEFAADQAVHLAEADLHILGWTHLASGARPKAVEISRRAHDAAYDHGRKATLNLIAHAGDTVWERCREDAASEPVAAAQDDDGGSHGADLARDRVTVCPALGPTATRMRDVTKGHEHVIGEALPLTPTPRWFSTEPCHPFLAVSRARAANLLVIVDEVDKAATRTDHGRLWDALLPFLERETASAYPDPALQVDLDLCAVSFVIRADDVAGPPAPLVDRWRVIESPESVAGDLASLLPPLVRDHARDLGLDPRSVEPLDQEEAATLRRLWRGGSVRRLRALLDVLPRGRERLRPVH